MASEGLQAPAGDGGPRRDVEPVLRVRGAAFFLVGAAELLQGGLHRGFLELQDLRIGVREVDGNEKLADGHQNVAGGANGLQVILHLITPLLRVARHEGAAANTEARASSRLYRFLESCRGIVVGGVAFGVVGICKKPEQCPD